MIIGRASGKSTLAIKEIMYRTIESKKREIWIAAHPEEKLGDRVIILLNGNPSKITPDNLMAITRQELVVMNRMKGFSKFAFITKLSLSIARLKIKRAAAIKGTYIEKEDKWEAQRKYQKSPKGRITQNRSSKTYWARHSADPEWRAEYNRKQRERRHREVLLHKR